MSVVICSLNGAPGVDRCLRALEHQSIGAALELIVVDDGSADATAAVGHAHGARVIRHPSTAALSAARNSGIRAARAPVVAFLDDDCVPDPRWAESLLASYDDGVEGVGGPVIATRQPASCAAISSGITRSGRWNWSSPGAATFCTGSGCTWVASGRWTRMAPGGMSTPFPGRTCRFGARPCWRGGLDDRFRFGAEELDLCMRLTRESPAGRLVYAPEARVTHHFRPSAGTPCAAAAPTRAGRRSCTASGRRCR